MGTCDAAREREATKELINILTSETELNQDLVHADEKEQVNANDVNVEWKDESANSLSVEDILKNEINEIKQHKHNGSNNDSIKYFTSINTGIKGIVLVRVNRKSMCPVLLLKSLFDRIRSTRLQVSRYLAKVVPLQICFFPTEDDLVATLKLVVNSNFIDHSVKSLPCLYDSINEGLKTKKRKLSEADSDEKRIDSGHDVGKVADDDNAGIPECDNHDSGCSIVEPTTAMATYHSTVPDHVIDIHNTSATADLNNISTTPACSLTEPAPVATTSTALSPLLVTSSYLLLFKARNHNVLTKTSCLQHLRQLMPPHLKQDYLNSHNAIIVEALKNLGGVSYFPNYYDYCELNIRKFQSECMTSVVVAPVTTGDVTMDT